MFGIGPLDLANHGQRARLVERRVEHGDLVAELDGDAGVRSATHVEHAVPDLLHVDLHRRHLRGPHRVGDRRRGIGDVRPGRSTP